MYEYLKNEQERYQKRLAFYKERLNNSIRVKNTEMIAYWEGKINQLDEEL